MAFRGAVITFPGSNCDRDMAVALEKVSGEPALRVWHGDPDLPERLDFIAVPGGFSYGDYLRCGAIASRSPVMRAVIAAAERGVPVLGVCNGFQVLTESGLLPGALMRNAQLNFTCRDVPLVVENNQSLFTARYAAGTTIACRWRTTTATISPTPPRSTGSKAKAGWHSAMPTKSTDRSANIAGVLNAAGNVLGMMPHPERAIEPDHGGSDGRQLFESAVGALVGA